MPFLHEHSGNLRRSEVLQNQAKRNGLRHAIFNTVGDKYIGVWKDDIISGKCSLLTRVKDDGFRQLYEGDFKDGFRDGFGVLSYQLPNKVFILEYKGDWKRGKMNGFGIRKYRDGGYYVGYMKNSMRHGSGHMWYTNGDFYAGNYWKDMKHGLGMLVLPNVNRYEGNWKYDMKHGKGRFLNLDSGQIQDGVWTSDVCVYSTMRDLKYRQTSPYATKYSIRKIELLNLDEVCTERELKALEEYVKSCLELDVERLEDAVTAA